MSARGTSSNESGAGENAVLAEGTLRPGCPLCGGTSEREGVCVETRERLLRRAVPRRQRREVRVAHTPGLCGACHRRLLVRRLAATAAMALPLPLLVDLARSVEPHWVAAIPLVLYAVWFAARVRYGWSDRLAYGRSTSGPLAASILGRPEEGRRARLPVSRAHASFRLVLAAMLALGAVILPAPAPDPPMVARAEGPQSDSGADPPSAGASRPQRPGSGELSPATALERALRYGRLERVDALLEERPGLIRHRDAHGRSVLHLAVRHPDVTALLLEKGAEVDARDGLFEETALHWAVRANRVEVVELLIEHGADVNARNSKGETPLALARQFEMAGVQAALENVGAEE